VIAATPIDAAGFVALCPGRAEQQPAATVVTALPLKKFPPDARTLQ
jgi:hypothetical protein